jgi:site-specific DNA-methyltransferase (adenine-specific)
MNQASRQHELGQYPTPVYVAEALVDRYFADLGTEDVVWEPSCGPGSFLEAIPAHVPAFGTEIDPELAERARRNTGREVITGDYRTVELVLQPTAIIGNPPFRMSLVDALLERAHQALPEGGRMGLILPVYAFQTAARVSGYARRWGIEQTLIPRNIYPGLQCPLCFAVFSKDRRRTLIGFALYDEAAAVQRLSARYQRLFTDPGEGSLWGRVIEEALVSLGGEGSLEDIYREVEGRRPTDNRFWREQIRKVARRHFPRAGRGRYRLRYQAELQLAS